jgi:hypothetical protein
MCGRDGGALTVRCERDEACLPGTIACWKAMDSWASSMCKVYVNTLNITAAIYNAGCYRFGSLWTKLQLKRLSLQKIQGIFLMGISAFLPFLPILSQKPVHHHGTTTLVYQELNREVKVMKFYVVSVLHIAHMCVYLYIKTASQMHSSPSGAP